MIYDMYRTLTPGIGWRTDKSLSEQLREEQRAMAKSAEYQRKRDAADKIRLYKLKREKRLLRINPHLTADEMDELHRQYSQKKLPVTPEEIELKKKRDERKRISNKKRRQKKRLEKYLCTMQT